MTEKPNGKEQEGEQQALIVWIRLSDDGSGTSEERQRVFKLEDEMMRVIEESGVGEYDGNEIGGGFFTLYMYGPSASQLWKIAEGILTRFEPSPGSYAITRYGKPGAREVRISLAA